MTSNAVMDWLKFRKTLLTASDIPAILGLSPYKTNVDVYMDKIAPEIDNKQAAHLQFGHDVETAIANVYAFDTGHIVKNPGDYTITRHPEITFIGATLDRTYQETEADKKRPLELKSVLSGIRLEDWAEDPPIDNVIQLQTQCSVIGADKGKLAGLFQGYRVGVADVDFDERFFNSIIPTLDEFWNHNVKKKIAPDLIPHKNGLDSIKRLYPIEDGNTTVMPSFLELANNWEEAKRERNDLNKSISLMETEMRETIGANTFGNLGDGTFLTLKETHKKASVTKASTFRTLRRKRF